MHRIKLAVLAGACAVSAACFSLDVTAIQPVDGTNYSRDSVLKDPGLMELAIASSFVAFWSAVNTEHPNVVLGVLGEEMTSSATNFSTPIFIHTSEPRLAFDNSITQTSRLARDPWGFLYEGNSAAAELGGHLKRTGLRVIDPATGRDNTHRVLTFAKWQMGMAHTHIGVLFDSGAVINENANFQVADILPITGYQEVIDSGIKWLEESIAMTEQEPFVLPINEDIWIFNNGVSSAQLAAIAHGYIARTLAFSARTPDDPVDWAKVKFHAALGPKTPFGPRGDSQNSFINFLYKRAITAPPRDTSVICTFNGTNVCGGGAAGFFRVDNRLVGPADSSGAYQEWLSIAADPVNFRNARPFNVLTKDARIQEPAGLDPNQSAPVYFKHAGGFPFALWPLQSRMDTLLRGTYYVSFYWNSTRARDNRTQWPATGGGRSRDAANDFHAIIDEMMVPAEMDLLLAEAEYRLGNLQAAADLVNKSRVTNGELPPVTVNGVPNENSCVPKRWDGTCGDLWDALIYEKRIETYGTGIAFYDLRRWGCLLEGTWTQLPVPGQQLDLMGKQVYSYGGEPGAYGSAPKPNNCPLLHKPT